MRTRTLLLSLGLALAAVACGGTPAQPELGLASARSQAPLNAVCPRSGDPVVADSVTEYRGHVVGFCNTHCRDDFAAHSAERSDDRAFFDALIAASSGPR